MHWQKQSASYYLLNMMSKVSEHCRLASMNWKENLPICSKKNYKTSNLQISKLQIKNIEHENEFQWSQQARTHEYMQPSKRILLMIWQNWTNGFITFKYTAQSQQKWQHKLTSSTTRTRNLSSFKICFSCIRHKLPIVATRICGGSAWFQSQA